MTFILFDFSFHFTFLKHSAIFQRYQEQPQLLDSHLESIVHPLINIVKSAIKKVIEIVEGQQLLSFNPSLILAFLGFIDGCCNILYFLCKVRGYKPIVNFFPNSVSDLHLVLDYIVKYELILGKLFSGTPPPPPLQSALSYTDHWETRYIILLWLWGLCLIPFNMSIIDSDAAKRIISVSMSRLHYPDITSDAASSVIAR